MRRPAAATYVAATFAAGAAAARALATAPEPQPHAPASERPVRAVEPARRSRTFRRRVVALLVVALVLATPFALVFVHVQLTANEIRLTSLQSRGDQAQERNEKLRLEVAQLGSPARVVAAAQQLGMVTPSTIHYLPASPGSSTAGPAAAPDSSVQSWAIAKHVDRGR